MIGMKKYMMGLFVGINQGNIVSCHGKQTENSVLLCNKKKEIPYCMENGGNIIDNHVAQSVNMDMRTKVDESSSQEVRNLIEIHSVEQLIEIAKQINIGDPFYCKSNYKLLADLDFKKRKWIPMGMNQQFSFCGTFDGNGHAIKNLRIRGKKRECIGFFGYVRHAHIYNLSIEGKMKGGKYTGAIAGINDGSIISYCFASAKLYGHYCIGGLVGKNQGDILHCYYVGSLGSKFVSP